MKKKINTEASEDCAQAKRESFAQKSQGTNYQGPLRLTPKVLIAMTLVLIGVIFYFKS